MKQLLLTTIGAVVLVGCDMHIDSVFLGRTESKFLGAVGRGDTKTVKAYLDKGGNVNLQDEPGMTPLHRAVNGNWNGTNLETIKLLISRGANANAIDDTHHTPLHLCNNKEIAELLIDSGANVNAKTKRTGETVLFKATHGASQGASKSYQKYLGLTKILISKGADVNIKLRSGSMINDDKPYRDKSGDTVLHQVVRSYSEKHASEVSELLINNGAKINERNILGQTPLDEALLNQRNKTADLLRKHGGKTKKELEAAELREQLVGEWDTGVPELIMIFNHDGTGGVFRDGKRIDGGTWSIKDGKIHTVNDSPDEKLVIYEITDNGNLKHPSGAEAKKL